MPSIDLLIPFPASECYVLCVGDQHNVTLLLVGSVNGLVLALNDKIQYNEKGAWSKGILTALSNATVRFWPDEEAVLQRRVGFTRKSGKRTVEPPKCWPVDCMKHVWKKLKQCQLDTRLTAEEGEGTNL